MFLLGLRGLDVGAVIGCTGSGISGSRGVCVHVLIVVVTKQVGVGIVGSSTG